MEVDIQVQCTTKTLSQCYGPDRAIFEQISNFVDQMCRNCAVNDMQNLTRCLGVGSEQIPQGKWKTDDPLTQWYVGKYFIREKGGFLGHAAGAAAGVDPPWPGHSMLRRLRLLHA
jgi:hypothetical protein